MFSIPEPKLVIQMKGVANLPSKDNTQLLGKTEWQETHTYLSLTVIHIQCTIICYHVHALLHMTYIVYMYIVHVYMYKMYMCSMHTVWEKTLANC